MKERTRGKNKTQNKVAKTKKKKNTQNNKGRVVHRTRKKKRQHVNFEISDEGSRVNKQG